MLILVDADGCMLNMHDAIKERNHNFKPREVKDYDFINEGYGITREEVFSYLSDKKTFELQKPYKGAKEGINQLNSLGKVVGYTTVPEEVKSLRKHQMHKLGVRNFSIHTGDKPIIKNANVIIEDCPRVLDKYKEMDCIRIIIDHPYNRGYTEAIRCKNLVEAAQIVKKITRSFKSM